MLPLPYSNGTIGQSTGGILQSVTWYGGCMRQQRENSRKVVVGGFTIVELLIVIVVIGILAAITIVSYGGMQRRAQVVATVDGLKKIEKSLTVWMIDTQKSTWPLEPTEAGGTPFSDMITADPTLKDYLQRTPAVQGIGTQEWFYDNDGPMKRPANEPCDDMYRGVNIVIRYITDIRIAEAINKTVDGSANPSNWYGCGKVRWHGSANGGPGVLFYALSPYGELE